jgi:CRP-like cAMP-binding protein
MHHLELTERLLRLRLMPALSALPPGDLAQLAASLRPRAFETGEVLLHEDLPPRAFFLVRNGTVTMRRHGKRIGTVTGPGGVGFMSALARSAGGTECVADGHVDAYEVETVALDEIFEDHFAVLLGMIRLVAERLVDEMRTRAPQPFVPPRTALDHLIGDRELGVVERIFLLRRTRAFDQANVNTLATLARRMKELRVPAGSVVWSPGERATHSHYIVKGMGRLEGEDGKVQPVGPGYVIGGAEALVGRLRWNRFVVDDDAVLLRGEVTELVDLFEDDHDLALRFLSMLATTLMASWDRNAERGIASVGTGKVDAVAALEAPSEPVVDRAAP